MGSTTAPRTGFPFRHATRLLNAYQLAVGSLGLTAFDRHLEAAVLFFMIHRAALRAPDDPRISINAIATSVQQSPETMRRAARVLVEAGLCRAVARGVERAPGFADHALVRRIEDGVVVAFDGLLSGYDRSGLSLPPGMGDRPRGEVLTAALDAYLSVLELAESRTTKPILLHIIGAVTVLNAALLTQDVELGLLYGHDDTVPPHVLRIPVTARQVADETGLAATTVWRHLAAAEKAGVLTRGDHGYLLAEAFMDNPVISARSRQKIGYLHRVFHDLATGRYGARHGATSSQIGTDAPANPI